MNQVGRQAMTQGAHKRWNATHYPGTRQICCKCAEPTGLCEEDGIFNDDGEPHCYDCAISTGLIEISAAN